MPPVDLVFSSLINLNEKQRKIALDRYRQIEPYLKKEVLLTAHCKENELPLRTAKRWVSLYQKHGLVALAHKTRKDKGKIRTLSPEICQFELSAKVGDGKFMINPYHGR